MIERKDMNKENKFWV